MGPVTDVAIADLARRLGRTSVAAEVRHGERADAMRFAVEHGRRQRGSTAEQALRAIMRRQVDAGGDADAGRSSADRAR